MDGMTRAAINRARAALDVALPKGDEFSLARMIAEHCADSWGRDKTPEFLACRALQDEYGVLDRRAERIPYDALVLQRDLNASTASAGGYLAAPHLGGYLPALQPASIALRFGAQVLPVPASSAAAMPSGNVAVTTTWLSSETAQATETQPTLGQIAGTPKILSAFAEVSRQLLLQSNAEEVIRLEFRNAAAAALDAAIFAGSGASGQPLGIVNTAGIGTFTGASMSAAALRNAQADVATAKGIMNPAAQGYAAPPAVAEILAARQRFTGASSTLWEGSSAEGIVEGVRAASSANVPAATMIYGDFSQCFIAQWGGGLAIEIDPYTKFKEGIVGVRLLLAVDVAIRPAAFSVATGVS